MLADLPADLHLPSPYAAERPSDPDATQRAAGGAPQRQHAARRRRLGRPASSSAPNSGRTPRRPRRARLAKRAARDGADVAARRRDVREEARPAHGGHRRGRRGARLPGARRRRPRGGVLGRGGPASQAAIQGSGLAASTGTRHGDRNAATADPGKLGQTNIPSADESADGAGHLGGLAAGGGRAARRPRATGGCQVVGDAGVVLGVGGRRAARASRRWRASTCRPGRTGSTACRRAGKTRTASVSIAEGTATHYRFTLDE